MNPTRKNATNEELLAVPDCCKGSAGDWSMLLFDPAFIKMLRDREPAVFAPDGKALNSCRSGMADDPPEQ